MSNQQLLKNSIEIIKQVREELRNDIDNSKREKLDQVIEDLERCDAQKITTDQLLIFLGKVVEKLPSIERMFEILEMFN